MFIHRLFWSNAGEGNNNLYLEYSLSLAYGLIKGYPKEIATVSLALSQRVSVRNTRSANTRSAMPIDTTRIIPTRRSHRKITEEELRDIEMKRIKGKSFDCVLLLERFELE